MKKNLCKHGVGLGLTISKSLIQKLGPEKQKIRIDSVPGGGTTFTFLIYKDLRAALKSPRLKKIRSADIHLIRAERNTRGTICQSIG
jgi:hypothetical protein